MENDKLEVRQYQNTFLFIKLFIVLLVSLIVASIWIFRLTIISTLTICVVCLSIVFALFYIIVGKGVIINRLSMDRRGFDYIKINKESVFIPWESINFAYRTKHFGNSIVLRDVSGNEFWFNTNQNTETAICELCSDLATLIPAKDDFRKWQEWDKRA